MATQQVTFVKQKIIQYIYDHKLKYGRRLPSQKSFCTSLNVGSATVSTALKELSNEGILKIHDKVGVTILRPNTDGHIGRYIGITPPPLITSLYNCCLLHLLQQYLLARGCQPVIFYCLDLPEIDGFQLETFPGLKRNLEQHALDAVFDLAGLSAEVQEFANKANTLICKIGFFPSCEMNYVNYDMAEYITGAVTRLRAKGCSRLGLLVSDTSTVNCLQLESLQSITMISGIKTVPDGIRWIHEALESGMINNFDGLICFDDMVTLAVASELVRSTSKCKSSPWLVTSGNQQIPLVYPLKQTIVCMNDLDIIAKNAVDSLLSALQSDHLEPIKKTLPFQWKDYSTKSF
ncbi:MAG: GntR family transcriptional regulator [Lentisphaeria bacterium]